MHQSSKSLRPSSRVGPEVSKTPPTCKVWVILSQVMEIHHHHGLAKSKEDDVMWVGTVSVSGATHWSPCPHPGPMTREKPISQGYGPIRSHRHTESELPWPRREWRPRRSETRLGQHNSGERFHIRVRSGLYGVLVYLR